MSNPQDSQLAAAALALLANAQLNITGKDLGNAVAVHNWLEAIRTGEHGLSQQPGDLFQHHTNGLAVEAPPS